jgi:signal transduction histidine kinase
MNLEYILLIIIVCLVMAIGFLVSKISKTKQKIKQILIALDDIQGGNLNRRVLADSNDITADICYKTNEIVQKYKEQLSQAATAEKMNNQIMTSLSHDVRTPLTTLIGYLDAIHDVSSNVVEREQYIETSRQKAYAIKSYTDDLFEWFKINSNEKLYHFETVDINELSRNIMIEWIPQFDKAGLSYDVEIADNEIIVSLDIIAYNRILNNLIHNTVKHSGGSHIRISINDCDENVVITVSDNGKGIPAKDLPYVFERLYKCDDARRIGGSGLGLYIVYELVKAHGGIVSADSTPNEKTAFIINMKKARLRQGFGKVEHV